MKYCFLVLIGMFLEVIRIESQVPDLERLKQEIAYHSDVMVNASLDRHRIKASQQLEMALDSFLNIPESYSFSLDSIPWVSVVHGEDFRFLTWQLRISNDEYKYAGILQWADRIVRFHDTRPFINGSSFSTYTPSGWYGCLYYDLVPFEHKDQKYYVLLGFHAENSLLNTKVADILDLSGADPRLGVPVFTGKEEPRTRLMLTYADFSTAHLKYDPKLKGIIHDHLETLDGIGPNGESLPVSDGSLEGWILKKGNWVYEEEVYDVSQKVPPMTDERKDYKEDKDILGRPKKQ